MTADDSSIFQFLSLERDSHSQNQNEILGMSSYPIETSGRNLPNFGRKLIPRQLLAKIITVVTWVHTSQMGTKFGVNSWICMTFHCYVLPHCSIGSWRHTCNVCRQLISSNLSPKFLKFKSLLSYLSALHFWEKSEWATWVPWENTRRKTQHSSYLFSQKIRWITFTNYRAIDTIDSPSIITSISCPVIESLHGINRYLFIPWSLTNAVFSWDFF